MYGIVFTTSVLTATIGYVVVMSLGSSDQIKGWFMKDQGNNAQHVLFQRLFGVFIFGVLPLLALPFLCGCHIFQFGFGEKFSGEALLWTGLLALVLVPVNYMNSKKPCNLAMYPQIRNKEWSRGLLVASGVSWVAYLLAYELLFRGLLLFSSLEIMGYWPAILLNTGIYSLAHYPKGKKEAYGSIPLGIVLCVLSLKTGNFWMAFMVHTILALTNEWFSLRAHETINLKKAA